jgi:hypothetical protein
MALAFAVYMPMASMAGQPENAPKRNDLLRRQRPNLLQFASQVAICGSIKAVGKKFSGGCAKSAHPASKGLRAINSLAGLGSGTETQRIARFQ